MSRITLGCERSKNRDETLQGSLGNSLVNQTYGQQRRKNQTWLTNTPDDLDDARPALGTRQHEILHRRQRKRHPAAPNHEQDARVARNRDITDTTWKSQRQGGSHHRPVDSETYHMALRPSLGPFSLVSDIAHLSRASAPSRITFASNAPSFGT